MDKPEIIDIENLDENHLFNTLSWGSYKRNRDDGVSHETLLKWSIAKPGFKEKYEALQTNKKL